MPVYGVFYPKTPKRQVAEGGNMEEAISLPPDHARIEQLQKKLAEYQQRVDPFRGPELQQDAVCKAVVLGTLLERGTVRFTDLYEMVTKSHATMKKDIFVNAWCVVRDYCETGGEHVYGGRLPTR